MATAAASARGLSISASHSAPITISAAIASRNARTGLSRAAAAINHMAQVWKTAHGALPPADVDLSHLAPRRSATRPVDLTLAMFRGLARVQAKPGLDPNGHSQ